MEASRNNNNKKTSFWFGMMFMFEISIRRLQDAYETFRSRSPLSSLAKEEAISEESCPYTWNADPSLPLLKSFLLKKVTGMRDWGVHVGMGEGDNIKWDHFPRMLGCEIWENIKHGQRNHKAQMLILFSQRGTEHDSLRYTLCTDPVLYKALQLTQGPVSCWFCGFGRI